MNRNRLSLYLLAASCVAAVTFPHTPAEACRPRRAPQHGRTMLHSHRYNPHPVAQTKDAAVLDEATEDLNAGRNADVISALYARYGADLNGWALNAAVFGERERSAVLMVALAVLRSEGALSREVDAAPLSGRAQADNVRWAIRAMEGLAFVGAAAERHVAEAWGRDPELKDAALDKLDTLQAAGALQSRFQEALLARLRAERMT